MTARLIRICDFGSELIRYSQGLALQNRLAEAVRKGEDDALLLLQVTLSSHLLCCFGLEAVNLSELL